MCNPAAVGLAFTILGTTTAVVGQQQQSQFQSDLGNRNAKIGGFQAEDAQARGQIAVDQQRARVRQIEGAQKAAMGATGLEGDSQTFDKVLDQTATLGEQDAATIRTNALREAWGFRNQAQTAQLAGDLGSLQAKAGAVGSLLTGATQAYGLYRQSNPGVGTSVSNSAQWWR